MTYELSIYKPNGKKPPFEKWLDSLKDKKTRQIIQARMDRAAFGNLGDVKSVGEDVIWTRVPSLLFDSRAERFCCFWSVEISEPKVKILKKRNSI